MTDTSILANLGLSSEQAPELRSNDRNRLLNFLLRWDYIADLHACLDAIIPRNRPLVSLLDLRTRALLAEDKPQEALPVMQKRLRVRPQTSLTSQSLLARVYLALEDYAAAQKIAHQVILDQPDSITAWGLLGEVELAAGDQQAALAAYRHLQENYPYGRAYLQGMVDVYRAQEDWVTATAYAVRLLRTAEEQDSPLPIPQLRHLLAYFRASGDATRAADLEAELAHRHSKELDELRVHFAQRLRQPVASPPPPRGAAPRPSTLPAEFVPTFDQVPISESERAAITHAVRQLFGFAEFLPGQVETIACALRNEDTLTILPTGGGKSLCYQVPAFLAGDEAPDTLSKAKGTTVVISPLIALMKDQVDSLPEQVRIHATTINSSLNQDELRHRMEQVAAGGYRLVYAAPERLRQQPFLHLLRRAGINRLVIDEAHCVSVWGHDFRPDYLFIAQAREALGHPPLLALTATAPPRVRRDILQRLGEMRIVAGDVTRPNLRLSVYYARNTDDKLQRLITFCKTQMGSGIIYAGTRARCERLAALLRSQGLDAVHYHAGIDNRADVQDNFMNNHARIVVATVAFGMGIDKPDIRFIVHFVPPPSLESYYQEAGRAGRDGLPAECLLMYASSDRAVLTRRAHEDVMPVEFLRGVYSAVRNRLAGNATAPVPAADLGRDVQADDVRVRVALSLLEEAGLLRRGLDIPRSALVTLLENRSGDPCGHPATEFDDFCRVARLRPQQALTLNLVQLAGQLNLSLEEIELRLLEWAEAGLLRYVPAGRDLCLTLLPPPQDAAERVATLLERYQTIQEQRVDEITAYAQTARCRHGYLNAYLGGRTIEHCEACDNCVPDTTTAPLSKLPDEREQAQAILRVLATFGHGWGRASLTSIMQGNAEAPETTRRHKDFGALVFRSKTAIGKLIQTLEQGGFIQTQTLSHGGVTLTITPRGQAALEDRALLDAIVRPQRAARQQVRPQQSTPHPRQVTLNGEEIVGPEVDESLYKTLKTWRLELARQQKVPSYAIFNDETLSQIAAHKPTSLESLETVKGIGPKKVEKYGEAVIELVRKHNENE